MSVHGCHNLFLLNEISAGLYSSFFFVVRKLSSYRLNVSRIEVQIPDMANKDLSLTVIHFFFCVIGIENSPRANLKFMCKR